MGRSPITGAFLSQKRLMRVPQIKANNGGGIYPRNRLGQKIIITSEKSAMKRASEFRPESIFFHSLMAPVGPLSENGKPANGSV